MRRLRDSYFSSIRLTTGHPENGCHSSIKFDRLRPLPVFHRLLTVFLSRPSSPEFTRVHPSSPKFDAVRSSSNPIISSWRAGLRNLRDSSFSTIRLTTCHQENGRQSLIKFDRLRPLPVFHRLLTAFLSRPSSPEFTRVHPSSPEFTRVHPSSTSFMFSNVRIFLMSLHREFAESEFTTTATQVRKNAVVHRRQRTNSHGSAPLSQVDAGANRIQFFPKCQRSMSLLYVTRPDRTLNNNAPARPVFPGEPCLSTQGPVATFTQLNITT